MTFIANIPGGVTTATAPPVGAEIAQPFRIDSTGAVTVIVDRAQAAIQHLLSIALTSPGERVMRPTFGGGLNHLVFEEGSLGQFQKAAQTLQAAYSVVEGGVVNVVVGVTKVRDGVFAFDVKFKLDQDPVVHQAVFDFRGNLVGETS